MGQEDVFMKRQREISDEPWGLGILGRGRYHFIYHQGPFYVLYNRLTGSRRYYSDPRDVARLLSQPAVADRA